LGTRRDAADSGEILISNGKGPIVARLRPNASDVVVPQDPRGLVKAPRTTEAELTRAQAHALRRCAPLTAAQFKARRLFADQGIKPPPRD